MVRFCALIACLAALPAAAAIAEPAGVAPALRALPGEEPAFALRASGVQIYRCDPLPDEPSRYAWLFTAPDTTLYDGPREVAHSASPNQWQSLDDLSSVSGVTTIQRVDTRGGAPPVTGCDDTHVGDEVRVPFTAEYYFYKPSAVG